MLNLVVRIALDANKRVFWISKEIYLVWIFVSFVILKMFSSYTFKILRHVHVGCCYSPGRNIWRCVDGCGGVGGLRGYNVWFCVFFGGYCRHLVSGGVTGGWAASTPTFDIFLIFPKILSLKLFGNSFGNSCTKFFMLDIKYHFTCGDSDVS